MWEDSYKEVWATLFNESQKKKKYNIHHWFSTQGDSASKRCLAVSEDSFNCHSCKGLLLASSGQRPETLLNILPCPGHTHHRR